MPKYQRKKFKPILKYWKLDTACACSEGGSHFLCIYHIKRLDVKQYLRAWKITQFLILLYQALNGVLATSSFRVSLVWSEKSARVWLFPIHNPFVLMRDGTPDKWLCLSPSFWDSGSWVQPVFYFIQNWNHKSYFVNSEPLAAVVAAFRPWTALGSC